MPREARFKSWSWSRLSDWLKCPSMARMKYIDKLPEPGPPTPHLERGIEVHRAAEAYVKRRIKNLPASLKSFELELTEMRDIEEKTCEMSLGFDLAWRPVATDDWDRCVLRVKVDVMIKETPTNAIVIDYKTGKYSSYKVREYEGQLQLYTGAVFAADPELEEVSPRLWYVDSGYEYPEREKLYKRKDGEQFQKMFNKQVRPMLADRTFKATPSKDACMFCPYNAKRFKGAPCKVGVEGYKPRG